MKYNRSLDLLAAAGLFSREGKVNSAAKAFTAAVKDPSFTAALRIIEASNKAARLKASEGIDADMPGEELRVDVEENGDRVVQEAKAMRAKAKALLAAADEMESDDADLSFLDEGEDNTADADGDLDEDDMDGGSDEETFNSASFIKAFGPSKKVKAAAAPVAKKLEATAFARAVRNLNAIK